jgi:glycosyltransferase involved in cell wall biosynthesis
MTRAPAVSVIVTVFNGGEFLPIAVDSILGQTFPDFELIIVDDGSTDTTPAQLKAVDDPRVRVIRNPKNLGLPAARNVGIEAANGNYCAFLDHDDVALSLRLQRQVDFLHANPAVGLIGSAVETINAAGMTLATIPMPQTSLDIRWTGLLDCPMRQSTLMGRTEVVKRHLYDTKFASYSDWDFVMRVSRKTEVRNLPEVLVQYRRHNTNMSTVHRARLNETGVNIALREIHTELPDFMISRHEIAELRRVLFETTDGPQKRTLDATRQALQRYIDLNEAFRRKHPRKANPSPGRLNCGIPAG